MTHYERVQQVLDEPIGGQTAIESLPEAQPTLNESLVRRAIRVQMKNRDDMFLLLTNPP